MRGITFALAAEGYLCFSSIMVLGWEGSFCFALLVRILISF